MDDTEKKQLNSGVLSKNVHTCLSLVAV